MQPLNDFVLVEPLEADDRTPGGIILPDVAKRKPAAGKVIAVGPGRWNDKVTARIPIAVSVGDVIYYPQFAGHEKDKQLFIKAEDILAVSIK